MGPKHQGLICYTPNLAGEKVPYQALLIKTHLQLAHQRR